MTEKEPWEDEKETEDPTTNNETRGRGRPPKNPPKNKVEKIGLEETNAAVESIYELFKIGFASDYVPTEEERKVDSLRLKRFTELNPLIVKIVKSISALSFIFGMVQRVRSFIALSRKIKPKGVNPDDTEATETRE